MSRIDEWLRSWRFLSWRTGAVAAFLVYTVVGFFVVPRIVERVLVRVCEERLARVPTVERIRANPFTLSLTIEGFSLPDRPGSTLLAFDRFYANAQLSSLFRWAGTLKRLEIVGPYIGARRFEDGEINLLEVLADFERLSPPKEDDEEKGALPRAILQDLVVSQGLVELEDRVAPEARVWQWTPLEVTMHGISTLRDRRGDDEITVALPEGGRLRLTGTLVIEPFEAEGRVEIEDAQLKNAWRAVTEKFGITLSRGSVDVAVAYRASLVDDVLHAEITDGTVSVEDLLVDEPDSGIEIVTLERSHVTGLTAAWPEQRIRAETLIVEGPYAHAWIAADGTPSWEPWVPEPTRKEIVQAYDYVAERVEIDASLGRLELRNGWARFEDRRFDEPQIIEATETSLVVTDITSQPESLWGLESTSSLGEGRTSAEGTVSFLPLDVDLEVGLESFDLTSVAPWVAELLPVALHAGMLDSSGRARVEQGDEGVAVGFRGELSVSDLDVDETVTGGTLVDWGELNVQGIDASLLPMTLAVENVDLYGAGVEIVVAQGEEGKTISLLEFLAALRDRAAVDDAGAQPTDSGLPPIRVDRFALHDCHGVYRDTTTVEPFERRLESIEGAITSISSERASEAEIEIDAAVDSGGAVRLAGSLDPFDPRRSTTLELATTDVLLPPMSPMSIEALGFPVDTGSLTLASSVAIRDRQLDSQHALEIDDLTLGEAVEGKGLLDLPIKLGVTLLKDAEGRITLDIPIAGDLENPEFLVGSAIRGAVQSVVGDLVKSPFRLLARLGGGAEDEDLSAIQFGLGNSELAPGATARLDTVAKALGQRPAIEIEITGAYASEAETRVLREQALAEALGVDTPGAASTDSLEQAFVEVASNEELEALRQQHSSAGSEAEPSELDQNAFREALVGRLLEAKPVDAARLDQLGQVRAEVIRAYLVQEGGIEASRIRVAVESSEAEAGGAGSAGTVASRLEVVTDE